ncbi:AraC family transcriptional regulator [Winogradskyella sp.]|uniref:helix-turn-helix domain-containing protein n=1 Tax=Winogradskyella sp. TaxID=1883156 RepID=UPI0026358B85|nr:helix-turn-helix domain-containing protein [Winogradskyella sp.]
MEKTYDIPRFLSYLNGEEPKNHHIHFTKYDDCQNMRQQSPAICIDFYLLAIKCGYDKNLDIGQTEYDIADSYIYFCQPQKTLEWHITQPLSGYHILLDSKIFRRFAQEYSFLHYKNHEALFLTKEEETELLGLFQKAYNLYSKSNFSQDVLLSYASLILSYTNSFYKRQFETRKNIYNKVVADFYKNLQNYYEIESEIKLPSVQYFANKANLTTNYFGDLIRHFTDKSPQKHINTFLIHIAKDRLRKTNHSISEIAYALGFESPSYFTRFFKKETGITPSVFRQQ